MKRPCEKYKNKEELQQQQQQQNKRSELRYWISSDHKSRRSSVFSQTGNPDRIDLIVMIAI